MCDTIDLVHDDFDTIEQRIAQRVERIRDRRERHRQRPAVVRLLVVFAGLVLVIPAVPLVLVLPEAGVPLAVLGLTLLALEFDWAVRALINLLRAWERLRQWYRRQHAVGKVAFWMVAIAIGVALYWLTTFLH